MTADRPFYIYCHTSPSGKRYIGQTCLEPHIRWNNGHGYDNCTLMHRAIEKYGWENFQHDIICVVHSRKVADLFEQYYIEKYKSFKDENGYNLTKGGAGVVGCTWDEERKKQRSEMISGENNPMYGHHHTKEVCEKMSRERKGVPLKPEHREKVTRAILEQVEKQKVPIRQLDLDGNLIRTYPSFSDMEQETGFGHSYVVNCCKGKANTAYGFRWEYVDDDARAKADEYRKNKPKVGVSIIQFDMDGNELARFSSITKAGLKTGLDRNKIGDCCFGGRESYGGYKWETADSAATPIETDAVIQCDLAGNEIGRFTSISDASSHTGVSRKRIRRCCRGDQKSAGGFIWRYEDERIANVKRGVPHGVVQIDSDGNVIGRFKSLTELERLGYNRHAIASCCKGEKESYKDFIWRYDEVA